MEHEPNKFEIPQPRPCSIPHSAPTAWLHSDDAAARPAWDDAPAANPLPLAELAAQLRSDPDALAEFIASLPPEGTRGDGWTPFARKLFLQVLADTGRVGLALRYVGLTKQSAKRPSQPRSFVRRRLGRGGADRPQPARRRHSSKGASTA